MLVNPKTMVVLSTVVRMISIFWSNFVFIYSFAVGQTNADLQHLKHVAHLDSGIRLMFQGSIPEALDELERSLAIEPDHYEIHHYLAMAYEEGGRWNSVILATAKSLELKPNNIEALYLRGKAFFNLGKWEKASKALQKAIDYAPKHARALKTLGKTQIQRRQFVEASSTLAKASELNPLSTITWYYLGMANLNQGNYKEAILHFEKSIQLAPTFPQAHHGLGTAYLRIGERGKGQEEMLQFQQLQKDATEHERLSRLTQAEPENIEALDELAKLSMKRENYPLAVKTFQRCIELDPRDISHYLGLSHAFMSLGHPIPSKDTLLHAIELSPNQSILYNTLGSAYVMMGDISKAIQSFQKAVGLDPEIPFYHLNLARVYEKTGHIKKAAEHYQAYESLVEQP